MRHLKFFYFSRRKNKKEAIKQINEIYHNCGVFVWDKLRKAKLEEDCYELSSSLDDVKRQMIKLVRKSDNPEVRHYVNELFQALGKFGKIKL
ncbi:hypothetical protein C0583_04565 [Candidatus Parcubacteria bacterium]|nr:MAG: hypothetical protein C0583_04565 [Candidatus Parcubacteria bacterium]